MKTHADNTQENKSQSVSNVKSKLQSGGKSTFQFVDNRPEAVAQRKLQKMANNSPKILKLKAFQEMANNSPQVKQMAQLQEMANNHSAQQRQPIQKKENNTGLPDALKSGMESISGLSLSDVKVHRNSDMPAQLQAHAYAQGTDIYLGPGQEKHLPHELGHVVQQKEGRVKPTVQLKGKININDDNGLEKEADFWGQKALKMNKTQPEFTPEKLIGNVFSNNARIQRKEVIQRQRTQQEETAAREEFKLHFIAVFSDNKWLTYGDRTRKVEDTALIVYDKLVSTLAVTNPAMDQVESVQGGEAWKKEISTKGKRYIKSSSEEKEVATGATAKFQAALNLAESFANELKDLTKQNKKAKELVATGFAFWSGYPAKFAAKNSGLAWLGGTLGGIFEDTKIPENMDMSIWGSISKAYAEWATENTSGKEYHGYVGLGGDNLNSIYSSVEKWALQMGTSENKNFRILWFPVIPKEGAYLEAKRIADTKGEVPSSPIISGDQYEKSPLASGGSDISDKGLTSRAEAEQKVREEDLKRMDKTFK
jgi:hypothetical protein